MPEGYKSVDLQKDDLLETRIFANQDDNSLISEKDLRWLGAGPLSSYLRSNDVSKSQNQLLGAKRLWNRLLVTMKASEVPARQIIAASNAISVFLQSACTSDNEAIVAFGLSSDLWSACVNLVADGFETGPAKALRQVLIVLINLLQSIPSRPEIPFLKTAMLADALDVIYTAKPGEKLKASVNIVELLLRKTLSLEELSSGLQQCRNRNARSWSRRLARDSTPVSVVLEAAASFGIPSMDQSGSLDLLYFIYTLWHDIVFTDMQPSVTGLFETVACKVRSSLLHHALFSSSDGQYPPWALLLTHLLSMFPTSINAFAVHLFPRLIKLDEGGYRTFALSDPGTPATDAGDNSAPLLIRLAAFQAGRQVGIFSTSELKIGNDTDSSYSNSALLSHMSGDVRVRAFTILVIGAAQSEPLEDDVLQAISTNLTFLYGDTDPNNRGEILSVTRRMILRIRSSSRTMRANGPLIQKKYEKFLKYWIGFLESELGPTCSYQRHICGLKVLDVLVSAGLDAQLRISDRPKLGSDQTEFEFHVSLHSSSMVSSLFNLLMDPFQDVRASAASLLLAYWDVLDFQESRPALKAGMQKVLNSSSQRVSVQGIISRAEAVAMSTHRADHADGLGRLYALLYTAGGTSIGKAAVLSSLIARVETHFSDPVIISELRSPIPGLPLHGLLVGIKYCVDLADVSFLVQPTDDTSISLIDRIFKICEMVWRRVKDRLCVDAPESEEDEIDGSSNDVGGPKDVLSYSWRALRDSSVLLSSVIQKVSTSSKSEKHSPQMTLAQCRGIGELSFEQLRDLRHRGAFSTVSQTFSHCCMMCAKSAVDGVPQLLNGWYRRAEETVDDQSLRLTRRSAGLPALFAAILGPSSTDIFNGFMRSFLTRATELDALTHASADAESSIPLPQVHILNCVREIITNANFRERTEEWIITALRTATICLACDFWAIRNCGLMLFRSCAQRLCRPRDKAYRQLQRAGVFDSHLFIPLTRWPESLSVAINILSKDVSASSLQLKMSRPSEGSANGQTNNKEGFQVTELPPERVFAGLDLLGRMRHSPTSWSEALPYILDNLGNRVWLIRDHAARIYAANIDPYEGSAGIRHLVTGFDACGENSRHGRLLAFSYVLKHIWTLPTSEYTTALFESFREACGRFMQSIDISSSPPVQSKFADIMTDILKTAFAASLPVERIIQQQQHSFLGALETPDTAPSKNMKMGAPGGHNITDVLSYPKNIMSKGLLQSLLVHKGLYWLVENSQRGTAPGGHMNMDSIHPIGLVEVDSNSALVALQEMLAFQATSKAPSDLLQDLLLHCIERSSDENVVYTAMNGLAGLLEQSEEKMSPKSLDQVFNNRGYKSGRKVWNARLRLRCAALRSTTSNEKRCQTTCRLCPCLKACHIGLQDEIDFPTRLNAVHSLRNLAQIIFQTAEDPITNIGHILQAGTILVDALNDDDEEIRELASITEADIGRHLRVDSAVLAPLAATRRTVHNLTQTIGQGVLFQLAALSRITAREPNLHSSDISDTPTLIDERFKIAAQFSDDLFEEEKQNLFVDDVRDIHMWANALLNLQPLAVEDGVKEKALSWSIHGLVRAKVLFQHESDAGPLSLAWKPDVVVLMTRIVACAELALKWVSGSKQEEVVARMTELEDTLGHRSGHGPVLQYLKATLASC